MALNIIANTKMLLGILGFLFLIAIIPAIILINQFTEHPNPHTTPIITLSIWSSIILWGISIILGIIFSHSTDKDEDYKKARIGQVVLASAIMSWLVLIIIFAISGTPTGGSGDFGYIAFLSLAIAFSSGYVIWMFSKIQEIYY